MSTDRKFESERFSGWYFSGLAILILVVNIVFSVIIMAISGSSGKTLEQISDTDWYKYVSFGVSPFIIISYSLIFARIHKKNILVASGIRRARPKYFIYILMGLIGMLFGLSTVNDAFVEFLNRFMHYESTLALPSINLTNFILCVIIICILPPLAEEIAFRGILQSELMDMNPILVAIYSGLMFSLFHMRPEQTIYQFLVGFIFGLVAAESGSILPSLMAHFLNNFIIICIYFMGYMDIPYPSNAINWIVTGIGLAFLAAYFVLMFLDIHKGKKYRTGSEKSFKRIYLYSLLGIIICLVLWLTNIASQFIG